MLVESELLENISKVKDYLTSYDPTPLFVEADTQALLKLFPDNCIDCVITRQIAIYMMLMQFARSQDGLRLLMVL